MDATPLLSVVVITMNRPGDLVPCLRSCFEQQFESFEVLVVDNASTDDTREIVVREFPEARLIALTVNRGVSGGRNAGVEQARGDVCVFIDDDAYFPRADALERAYRYFQDDHSLGALAFTILEQASGLEEMKSIPRRDKRPPSTDYEASYFCGAGFAVRRAPYLALGMFWPPLVYGSQEIDLCYRLLTDGWKIMHSRSVEVIHKSVPFARPHGQWVYFNTRDRPWVAVRNLPWVCVVSTTMMWWGNTFLVACRGGTIGRFISGVRDCLAGWSHAQSGRRVLDRSTREKLARLSGRLWY